MEKQKKVTIDKSKCIGCGTCASLCEQCFEIKDGLADYIGSDCPDCELEEVAESCPVEAITVEEA